MMLGLERADRTRIFSEELLDDGSNRASSMARVRLANKAALSARADSSELGHKQVICTSAVTILRFSECIE